MKRKDILLSIIILSVLALAVYFWQKNKKDLTVPEETPETSLQNEIQDRFDLIVPEDAEKITLENSSDKDQVAVVARKYSDDTFTLTVLADLPLPEDGKYYQAWMVRGKEGGDDYSLISLGRLSVAKGGYLAEFKAKTDYSDYNEILITKESVADRNPEEVLLKGSF